MWYKLFFRKLFSLLFKCIACLVVIPMSMFLIWLWVILVQYWPWKKTNYGCMYKQVLIFYILSKLNTMTAMSVVDNIHNKIFAHLYVYGEKWAVTHNTSKVNGCVYIRITYINYNTM